MGLFRFRIVVVILWMIAAASCASLISSPRSVRSAEVHVMPKPTVRRPLRLLDLQPDPHNANRGTDRGRAALERSLREYGVGRAVLIDRHGRVIAGNKTVEQAKRLNLP